MKKLSVLFILIISILFTIPVKANPSYEAGKATILYVDYETETAKIVNHNDNRVYLIDISAEGLNCYDDIHNGDIWETLYINNHLVKMRLWYCTKYQYYVDWNVDIYNWYINLGYP